MNGLWGGVWQALSDEFSDLPGIAAVTQILLRLLMAALLGGVLGYTRERIGKAAGMRTHMLVALGSAFFVLAPQQAGMEVDDLSRVIQGVISGIGFLGAGTILKLSEERKIKGLTTAASIWFTAAVGIAVGMGRLSSAILGTALAFLILASLRQIEARFFPPKKEKP